MDFFNYIKAVGTGPKGNRNLCEVEMIDAMKQMLEQKVHPEQTAAFLLGWRLQEETNEEMCGALKSFDKYIKKKNIPNSIELGNPYDGKQKRPYLFPLITKDMCVNLELEDNIYFFDRADYFKELSDLTQTRQRLGLRTGFNTIEKLLNPGNSRFAMTGAFHKPYVKKYLDLFGYHYDRLVIVKGEEGTCEFFGKSKYWIKENDEIKEVEINPADFGIDYKEIWEKMSIDEMKEVMANPSDELQKLVKLNAALVLFASKRANSLQEGYELLTK